MNYQLKRTYMIDELIRKQVEEFRKKFIVWDEDYTARTDDDPWAIEAHLRSSMKKVADKIYQDMYAMANYDENSDLDPSPELMVTWEKIYDYFNSLTQEKGNA